MEVDLGDLLGAVTDKGRRHHRNEDSMAVGALEDGTRIAVVCDGVSSSSRSDEASQAAADAAYAVLSGSSLAVADALVAAAAAAQAAVVALGTTAGEEAPSCTFVAAVVTADQGSCTVGWLGDSRAYLVGSSVMALTEDDSWATEAVASGQVTLAEAMADSRAHQITRWLAADAPSIIPRTATFALTEPALVLVVSDGLWNYLNDNDHLGSLVGKETDRTPVQLARDLCVFANEAGGHDNITVAVLPVRPTSGVAS